MDEIFRKRDSGILYKLDLEKAYDLVNWAFLYYMLRRMAFGNQWCKWIKKYVGSASFALLMNDSLTDFFHGSRGSR